MITNPNVYCREIFSALKTKFEKEWSSTSSHQLRQHNDMQFAFSYFHYLISEKEEFDIHKVFHQYDTDHSGESLIPLYSVVVETSNFLLCTGGPRIEWEMGARKISNPCTTRYTVEPHIVGLADLL